MELERLSSNQIKYSISLDELTLRGITEDEMLREPEVWDALFDEMLDEASRIYELEPCEAVAIEVFSMTANELILILTLDEDNLNEATLYHSEQTLDNEENLIKVEFVDFDDCISLARRLENINELYSYSSLYVYKSTYYLVICKPIFSHNGLSALIEEYGKKSNITSIFLEEYGKPIIEKTAIETINQNF